MLIDPHAHELSLGNFCDSCQFFISGQPRFPFACFLVRGNVLIRLGRNQKAAEEFRSFLQQAPADPRTQQIQHIMRFSNAARLV
jgi:hypothetical protein